MSNILSQLRSFSAKDSEAIQFIQSLDVQRLLLLQKELIRYVRYSKECPSHLADASLQAFLFRMDVVVEKLLEHNLTIPEESHLWCHFQSHATLLSCADYEKVNIRNSDGWKVAARVNDSHCYWYHSEKMQLVYYVYGNVSIVTCDNPLRFYALVAGKQAQFKRRA